MMAVSTYYRGRLSFIEAMSMPIGDIHTLGYLMYKHRDDQKDLREAEALEDGLDEIT